MSKQNDLAVMKNLVEIKYRQQQESFARLITQENRLRASLRQLDQQLADSRSSADLEQRAIGSDVLWQAWVGRKKRELNLQLAQILAVKERHVAQVKQAYGKVIVTESLLDQVKNESRKEKAQVQLDRAITSMLF